MRTYQDFEKAVATGKLLTFLRDAIEDHRNSDEFRIAETADEYDAQRNTTINDVIPKIYSATGAAMTDYTASNNRLPSNFFSRLNRQRCTYSLGNGVTFNVDGVKEKLGSKFDTDLFNIAYYALIHGAAFGFWNVDRLHVFPLTQFVPLLDELDGTLKAGIRYWCLDWNKKPVQAVLYEEDGFTKYCSKGGKSGLALEEIQPKRAYKQTISHTEAGGDEVIGEENYSSLPIVPLYGNRHHQSTLIGMRAAIDAYDMIQSGFCNDLTDVAQTFWIVGGGLGMTDQELEHMRDRARLLHVLSIDTDNSSISPYQQEPPYNAREACLNRISHSIYSDFGAFNPESVSAGNITATQIRAAYQTQDEEADAFEYQIIEFVQQILKLQGLDATPLFDRARVANESEEVQMVVQEANFLDDETILSLLPNITPDMIPEILARRDAQEAVRFDGEEPPETPETPETPV